MSEKEPNLVITGGAPAHESQPEPAHVRELYLGWRRAGVGKVQCSRKTFAAHLEFNALMCGPWEWELKDDVPYGDVYMYSHQGKRIGTVSVSDLVLVH